MKRRIDEALERFEKIEVVLGNSEILKDQEKYREIAQEYSHLSQVKELWEKIEWLRKKLQQHISLLDSESDPEMLLLLQEEISSLEKSIASTEAKLRQLLVPETPLDNRSVILEIRAGTGGDEAALFVGDCARMYKCFAESKGWKYELLSASPSERGGFKEYVLEISGSLVFRYLQYEAGIHRVQRVPKTEAQGRVHTSAITVAVLPTPTEEEQLQIDEKQLKIETYRASGAGGQHVNVTDSAVRITHLPTGTVVTCQEERSQHKNREKAMRLLSAKIVEEKRRKAHETLSSLRSSQVGSGDRSNKIRTYNFSQDRVTDHRINLTLHNLPSVLNGGLEELSQALIAHFLV